jgi:hypothetical protein
MRRSALVALLVVGALLVPLGVFASHQFVDVPNSHTFHNAIDWMKDNNITVGCNPPTNNRYCPDDPVDRGQMAAFMKRLAENQVVDAATLEGNDGSHYQGSVAGSLIAAVTPAASVRTAISTINGFMVPQNGGALAVTADVSMGAGAPGGVLVWLEVDGTGGCAVAGLPRTAALHDFVTEQFAFVGVSTTDAVSAGAHRIDLCAITENGTVAFGQGALTVEWVETTQVGTIASESSGVTPEEKLEELSAARLGE